MGKLVRLELYNFKSYKGHHVLLFGDSYFTSIIGPNGSGKSNSMDAISFVLGIKSSYLRSTHLRDLVYRGRVLKTSKIDANGDAVEQTDGDVNGHEEDDEDDTQTSRRNDPNTAWVMAVYEDDAGEEQKWKRTVTSAGSSEYRLNGKVVNAKQYNEALEAENILIKARNFLVFQGDVESIANQSPKDLTRLVEQISGSLEYKNEYEKLEEESEKANEDYLAKTNQRKGINGEIKRFTEEKKEADNYNRKQDERDDAVVTHVLWKLYHFQRTIEESSAEIERFQDELKEYRRGVEANEKKLDDAKKEQTKVGQEVSKQERRVKKSQKAMEENRNKLDPIEEKLSISRKNQDKYTKRIGEIAKERDKQAKAIAQLEKDKATVEKAQSKWDQESKQQAKKEGRQLKEADLQEYSRLKSDVNKRTADAQIKLDNLIRQRKTDEETVNSFSSKTEECEKKLSKLEEELQDLKQRKADNKATADQATKDVDTKKKEHNKLTSNRLATERKRTELDEKLHATLLKLSEADDGRRQSEKEIKAKELVVAMKRLFQGVRGRVHELCTPKQAKYQTAVSTVLGRHFDAIVVDTEKTAKDCIAYLREQRAGTATFIPLDTIQVKNVSPHLKGAHRGAKLAVDVIQCDNVLERAITFACGNALICEDLGIAKNLVFEKRVDARCVTLEGTVIHKGGLMTGGRGPNDQNRQKVWDESQCDGLRKVSEKLVAEISGLPKTNESAVQEETLQGELSALQQKVVFAQEELKALDKNLESKKKEMNHVQQQLDEVQPKYQEQSEAFKKLQQRISEYQNQVNAVNDEVFTAFCKRLKYDNIRSYEGQQGLLQQEGEQKKLEFSKQKNKLESQLAFESQRLSATETRLKNLEDADEKDKAAIAEFEEEKASLQKTIRAAEAEIAKFEEAFQQAKEDQDAKASTVADARRLVQRASKEVESTLKSVNGLEAEVQRNSSSRYALLRKCKIEGVKVPVTEDSASLDTLPVDEGLQGGTDPDAMDVDNEDPDTTQISTAGAAQIQDYGIDLDFSALDDDLKEDDSSATDTSLQQTITTLTTALQSLNPDMRAPDRLATSQRRLADLDTAYRTARDAASTAKSAFEATLTKRATLFTKALEHITDQIQPIYQQLTQSASFPLGGKAYLTPLSVDDARPFDGGIKYSATPPLKRFRDIDALSGGEKTIAALALLFAVHSYAPSPFFVLDEVDAALDNANVARVARYLREKRGAGCQFVVISLKTGLFQESDALIGIMRDQGANSSRAVTLDLRKYQPS